jgi:hypothetical protein
LSAAKAFLAGWGGAVVAVVAITLFAVAAYIAVPTADRGGYLSGLMATLIGVAIAIPLGLGADRWRQRVEQADRRRRVLRAIKSDLDSIGQELASRVSQRSSILVPFLGSGVWEAISASGQINDLDDAEQLRSIARAYDRISVTGYLERQVWELTVGTAAPNPLATPAGVRPPAPRIATAQAALVDQDRHTQAAIVVALQRIREALPDGE